MRYKLYRHQPCLAFYVLAQFICALLFKYTHTHKMMNAHGRVRERERECKASSQIMLTARFEYKKNEMVSCKFHCRFTIWNCHPDMCAYFWIPYDNGQYGIRKFNWYCLLLVDINGIQSTNQKCVVDEVRWMKWERARGEGSR